MKNESYVAEYEDEEQTFTETYNTQEDFLMTQNKHVMNSS